jgi:tRNA threonylcarbamoyladenosine biosynthesis protein TsaB
MIILTLRTDKPEAEIALFDDNNQLDHLPWQAHRELAETLHTQLDAVLKKNNLKLTSIQGIVFYKGPGSFTGLRIGAAVANATAHELSALIVGANGEQWQSEGIHRLLAGENDKEVVPEYGSPVHITPQKK